LATDDDFPDVKSEQSAKDREIFALSSQIEEERKRHKEQLFLAALLAMIFFDVFVFPLMNNWGDPVAILILEIIFLIVLANRCEVQEVNQFVDGILGAIGVKKGKESGSSADEDKEKPAE